MNLRAQKILQPCPNSSYFGLDVPREERGAFGDFIVRGECEDKFQKERVADE